jgi:hypothetical protein
MRGGASDVMQATETQAASRGECGKEVFLCPGSIAGVLSCQLMFFVLSICVKFCFPWTGEEFASCSCALWYNGRVPMVHRLYRMAGCRLVADF